VNSLQHSVVHRLPQNYRWGGETSGTSVEPLLLSNVAADDDLVGLSLLSHHGQQAWAVMQMIKDALTEIQLDSSVLEWEGEPCLFVACHDESATICRLKNFGVGIAEPFRDVSA